ncbi:M28 family peptidase [Terrimonas pollutisoli]|uniref:M28 family peptidase n=1 Tax=Terrimonas pollutisoli TaxID=3034147 RepID=UPI0023EBF512|nr:M28 family peptidase [Terrimonas sp. H1YJ31]
MRKFLLPALLLSCFIATAQKKNTPAYFAATISAEDMKKHLYIIAGPEMEGRDTPSPGLEKAANYIESHFKSLGLLPGNKDSYRQLYPLYKDSVTSTTLKVNGEAFELNNDFQPNTMINHTAEMPFSEVAFAGYGIVDGDIDSYKDLDVKGKLVMILDGSPAGYKPSVSGFNSPANVFSKIGKAQEKGASAVLIVYGNYPRKTFNGLSSYSLHGYKEGFLPLTFTISEGIAEKILGSEGKGILEKMKTTPLASKIVKANVDLGYFKTTSTVYASNVLGLIEGTDKKDEYVLITSHYDHVGKRSDGTIYYGADDDGSGTTGILELAEAFAKAKAAGKGPRRSVLFMTVSGEEKGLWGSEYYANHPVYPLEKTTVDLNIDMIGRIGEDYLKDKDSVNYVYIIGDDKLSTDLTPITEAVNSKYSKMKLDRKYNDPNDKNRFYYRSDHYNFAEKGVPVIFYFNGVHADYHRPTDTPDKINYKLMAKRGQLVFYTAWEMANRNEMLKRDLKLEKPKGF